jgi:ankyrin repeat protein
MRGGSAGGDQGSSDPRWLKGFVVSLVREIVDLGVEINARDSKGRTALHVAAQVRVRVKVKVRVRVRG